MSATIVQKSTSVGNTHYFECGDIFQTGTAAVVAAAANEQQAQQQQHGLDALMNDTEQHMHSYRLHGALTRTISQPAQQRQQQQPQTLPESSAMPPPPQQQQVASLVTIIENLSSMNLHRKLERTQSEPLPQHPMNTSRYKTELCRPYEEAGECKYGEKCQFAHGYHELRNLQRHPKYKTEYCRTFHSVGFCPYGPRCHFVHNADEARALQQQLQQQQQQQQQQKQTANFNLSTAANSSSKPQLSHSSSNNSNNNISQYFLPLSPPLSMSTGSDRESPTGSLSLSPTNSLTNFPFNEAMQPPTAPPPAPANAFGYAMGVSSAVVVVATPPESPNAPISPVHTPPPPSSFGPHDGSGKQLLQKSASTPNEEAPRLPVFNRLSANVDAFQQSNLGL